MRHTAVCNLIRIRQYIRVEVHDEAYFRSCEFLDKGSAFVHEVVEVDKACQGGGDICVVSDTFSHILVECRNKRQHFGIEEFAEFFGEVDESCKHFDTYVHLGGKLRISPIDFDTCGISGNESVKVNRCKQTIGISYRIFFPCKSFAVRLVVVVVDVDNDFVGVTLEVADEV